MARPARVSPDVILAAAAVEFAGRGFAGARVDRIARRAKVNKAMLYYHFTSKQTLYRTLLRRMFTRAAARLQAIAALECPSAAKVDLAIAGLSAFLQEDASFPAIMLREVAEGGAHLDRETLKTMAALPAAVARIVQEGVSSGAFRAVNPVFAYFSMVTPIVLFLAGTPLRKEISRLHVLDMHGLSTAEFVQQLQQSARRSLARDAPAPAVKVTR
jgi:TetR/AcrR family transcriptional regulator